jgi:hypothetical protein
MRNVLYTAILASAISVLLAQPTLADWNYSGPPTPNAFIQTGNMTLELQCDRIRFAPAGYEDAVDIQSKQGLSIRFLKNGSTEVGAFQAGGENASIRIVDNYPVEIVFSDSSSYDLVLDQIAQNAILKLTMIDQDVSYGIFDLKGSAKAIGSLRSACSLNASAGSSTPEAPEGIVYCGGVGVKRVIEYGILNNPKDDWDVRVTINGEVTRAMTAYSYFGSTQQPPEGFIVALLMEDLPEMLVFQKGSENYLEFGDYSYRQCN